MTYRTTWHVVTQVAAVQESLLYDLVDHRAIMIAETKLTQQDVDNKQKSEIRGFGSPPHDILC